MNLIAMMMMMMTMNVNLNDFSFDETYRRSWCKLGATCIPTQLQLDEMLEFRIKKHLSFDMQIATQYYLL
jgi:hypothetical protein